VDHIESGGQGNSVRVAVSVALRAASLLDDDAIQANKKPTFSAALVWNNEDTVQCSSDSDRTG